MADYLESTPKGYRLDRLVSQTESNLDKRTAERIIEMLAQMDDEARRLLLAPGYGKSITITAVAGLLDADQSKGGFYLTHAQRALLLEIKERFSQLAQNGKITRAQAAAAAGDQDTVSELLQKQRHQSFELLVELAPDVLERVLLQGMIFKYNVELVVQKTSDGKLLKALSTLLENFDSISHDGQTISPQEFYAFARRQHLFKLFDKCYKTACSAEQRKEQLKAMFEQSSPARTFVFVPGSSQAASVR